MKNRLYSLVAFVLTPALCSVAYSEPCDLIELHPVQDTSVSEKLPATVGPYSNPSLRISAFDSSWEGGADGRQRPYLKFDLSEYSGRILVQAELQLFQSDTTYYYPGSFILYGLSDHWEQSEITWSTQPAISEYLGEIQNAPAQYLSLVSANLNALVQQWADNPLSNFGIRVQFEDEFYPGSPNGARGDTIASLESTVPPGLVLTFEQNCAADLTGDCELDFFDVSVFLTYFQIENSIADFNNDGQFDFFDVSAFLLAFSAGCP